MRKQKVGIWIQIHETEPFFQIPYIDVDGIAVLSIKHVEICRKCIFETLQ